MALAALALVCGVVLYLRARWCGVNQTVTSAESADEELGHTRTMSFLDYDSADDDDDEDVFEVRRRRFVVNNNELFRAYPLPRTVRDARGRRFTR
jgi:hypothetical protein